MLDKLGQYHYPLGSQRKKGQERSEHCITWSEVILASKKYPPWREGASNRIPTAGYKWLKKQELVGECHGSRQTQHDSDAQKVIDLETFLIFV